MNPRLVKSSQPVDAILALTGDSFTAGEWLGASQLIGEYPVNEEIGSFVLTQLPPEATDYIIGIRGKISDGVSARFKLYSNGYEVLNYPVYNSELIPSPAVIEIWTHSQTPEGSVEVPDTTMLAGYLTRASCCNTGTGCIPTQPTYTLTSRSGTIAADDPCNPFCGILCYP